MKPCVNVYIADVNENTAKLSSFRTRCECERTIVTRLYTKLYTRVCSASQLLKHWSDIFYCVSPWHKAPRGANHDQQLTNSHSWNAEVLIKQPFLDIKEKDPFFDLLYSNPSCFPLTMTIRFIGYCQALVQQVECIRHSTRVEIEPYQTFLRSH